VAHDDLTLRDNVFPSSLKIPRTLNRRNRNAALVVAAPHLSTSPDSAGALSLEEPEEVRTVVACGSSWMCESKNVTVNGSHTSVPNSRISATVASIEKRRRRSF